MVLSDCVCPGHQLRLECTVVGGGTTVWTGSALDCTPSYYNRIILRHSQFENGTSVGCNNSGIIVRSINTTSDSDGIKYISQLIIQLDENNTLEGRTVECFNDDGLHEIVIGTHVISYTSGM